MTARLEDGRVRCAWALGSEAMAEYHDDVWGVPQRDARMLFEFLVLEGAQAGLSWSTILNKRAGYQRAFAEFEPEVVAAFGPDDVERLMQDASIVRNRLKITSAIDNARAWLALDDPVDFLWQFVGGAPLQNPRQEMSDLPATTEAPDRMSKELKRRGFRFVGSTICYALMQACGMVNDHVEPCFRQHEVAGLG
ncbi:MAG: DNA-3-methyladenine glycosylase I [Acidimicrobiia bacterium]